MNRKHFLQYTLHHAQHDGDDEKELLDYLKSKGLKATKIAL
jgi:hypothetical protein